MIIKKILGICECKGCWNKAIGTIDMQSKSKDGKDVLSKKRNICEVHMMELIKERVEKCD